MKKRRRAKLVSLPTETVIVTHEADPHASTFMLLWMFVKATVLACLFALATLALIFLLLAYTYLRTVSVHAGVGISSLLATARDGWRATIAQTNGRENILLLGVDTLGNRDSTAINTDTIIVASFDIKSGKIATFPIPRDLFLIDEKEKVNGIYNTALHAGKDHPEEEVKKTVEKLTGITVHRTVLLEMGTLGKLIDALGGISVDVERSFTDEKFPREDVDVTKEHDPSKLYKTISFQAGKQHMSGSQALEFIRSRHSKDPLEGSDDARAKRQQRVIEGLLDRLDDKDIPRNPSYVGDLIRLYRQDFQKFIPMEEVVAIGKVLFRLKRFPTVSSHHFSIRDFEKDPVFYHPERFYTGQWVYLPIDSSGKQLKKTVADWLP